MNGEVVLDIETKNTFQDVGGYFTDKLEISVVVAYYYDTDTYESYLEDEIPELCRKLEHASRIIGFNSKGFDIPVLNNYYPGDLLQVPQLDMLEKVYESLGFRLKLDSLAAATIGASKSAHGLLAVQWWKEGKIKEIIEYCKVDVEVTKELYEFGLKNGFLLFDDRSGERQKVEVDFSDSKEGEAALNLTFGL